MSAGLAAVYKTHQGFVLIFLWDAGRLNRFV
jgi:hypothetical protein